jgi:cell division protein FtsL
VLLLYKSGWVCLPSVSILLCIILFCSVLVVVGKISQSFHNLVKVRIKIEALYKDKQLQNEWIKRRMRETNRSGSRISRGSGTVL